MHMYVFFFLPVGYKDGARLPGLLFVKTKQHQQYFFGWVGVLIDVVATGGYWSDYCYTGWRDWNWVSLLPCSHRWSPPSSSSYTHTHTQTQRWFLQDLTITRGAFNQSGMQLRGASDGRGGGKGVITPSQSFSPVPPSVSLSGSLLQFLFFVVFFCFCVVHPLWFQPQTI